MSGTILGSLPAFVLQDARLLLGGRAEDVVGAPVPLPTYLAHAGECMRLSSFEWTLPPLFPCSRLDSKFGACGTWHDSAQVVPGFTGSPAKSVTV